MTGPGDFEEGGERERALVQYYISLVAHRVQVLMQRVKEAGEPGYASTSCATLCDILGRILSRFVDQLRELSQDIGDQPPEDIVEDARTLHYWTVSLVPRCIEAMTVAKSDSLITPLTEAYQDICNLVEYGTQAIIHPTWQYNASFDEVMVTLRGMASAACHDGETPVFLGAPHSFLIITYPAAEEDMILRQALIAHEVGHFVCLRQGYSKELEDRRLLDTQDYEGIAQAVETLQGGDVRDRTLSQAVALVNAMARLWIGEALADWVAVCLLGPAYLLAFDETSLEPRYWNVNKASRTHPPGPLRKQIMGGLVRELYLSPLESRRKRFLLGQQRVLDSVNAWVDTLVQSRPLDVKSIAGADLDPPVASAIYNALSNAVRRAVAHANGAWLGGLRKKPWFCKVDDVVDSLKLQELLECDLTPTELYGRQERHPGFAAIMNAGWFHFVHAKQDYLYFGCAGEESPEEQIREKYAHLQDLVSKAVESMLFRREFLRRRGRGHGQPEA